jgi:hypothetical protein
MPKIIQAFVSATSLTKLTPNRQATGDCTVKLFTVVINVVFEAYVKTFTTLIP